MTLSMEEIVSDAQSQYYINSKCPDEVDMTPGQDECLPKGIDALEKLRENRKTATKMGKLSRYA